MPTSWLLVYSIFTFFQLIRKTEKWKMDKNIVFSPKHDFWSAENEYKQFSLVITGYSICQEN